MNSSRLQDLDLNLLKVFAHLLRERHVSRVAQTLGMSQPAVSNALARLRKLLGNELFIRTRAGMQPTPYAEQLGQSVSQALGLIDQALSQSATFTPKTSEREITLAMTDIGEIYFLPRLLEHLAHNAPGLRLRTVRLGADELRDQMEAGKVDLAIGLIPQLGAGFFQRRLFQQRYVCAYRQGHALDGKRLSLKAFTEAEHVVVVAAGTGHGMVDEELQRQGVQRKVRLTVPHFVAVGQILQSTDLVATLPERLAESLQKPFGLAIQPHPVKLPEATIHLFWHARLHQDPANQWLREQWGELFGG
jgi:DNA-binding transcriptional LysR family regulator